MQKNSKVQNVTLILKKYQVQVYNHSDDMILTNIYDGFTPEEAIKKAEAFVKSTEFSNPEKLTYPLRFFTSFTE